MNKISMKFKTVAKVACGLMVATVFVACNNDDTDIIEPGVPASDVYVEKLTVQPIQSEGRVVNLETKANSPSAIKRVKNITSRTVGEDTLSATGVALDNVYNVIISYHLNGEKNDVAGGVEAWRLSSGDLIGENYIPAQTDVDSYEFNNLIYHSGYVYLVGNSKKKNGIISSVKFTPANGQFDSELKIAKVTGPKAPDHVADDVNSVVADGSALLVGSTDGFQLFNNSLVRGNFKLSGSLKIKSVAKEGENVVALAVDTLTREVSILKWTYSSTSLPDYERIETNYSVDNLNAKHTIALVDGVIYATLSDNGVAAFNLDGTKKWNFKLEQKEGKKIRTANGLDVAEGVVYVAYGANGIYMLNAADGTVIAKFDSSNLPWDLEKDGYVKNADGSYKLDENGNWIPDIKTMDSANAIKVGYGYIFVAQSQEGVVVYEYTEPEIEG